MSAGDPQDVRARQWLGLRFGDARYALPLASVRAAFFSENNQALPAESNARGVLVHEGEPVFVLPASALLGVSVDDHDGSWVVVLRSPGSAAVGLRASRLAGPFSAQPGPGDGATPAVRHDGQTWTVLDAPLLAPPSETP